MINELLKIQRSEITEYYVYRKLANITDNPQHKKLLYSLAEEEFRHYNVIKNITGCEVKPNRLKILIYSMISRVLGFNFGLKLMERGEIDAQNIYASLNKKELIELFKSEKEHENSIISMIDENILKYISSVVLGLNDALVELSGAVVGFTFALSDVKTIAAVSFITGFAASMSMGVSNYLSVKNDNTKDKQPLKSAAYTFMSYLFTVCLLVSPYLFSSNKYTAVIFVIGIVIGIVAVFNFYISVAMGFSFKRRFTEMLVLSLGVAVINYFVGSVVKRYFGV